MILNCITLPERQDLIKSEVDRLGITAIYWPAIVLQSTVQAISRSHKLIVHFAMENNMPEICIAEDDCIFTSKKSYQYFLENKPEDYDIYLGNHYSGIRRKDNTLYGFTGLTIYCIASRYYQQFLSTPDTKNIDRAQDGKGKFVVCQPEIARQRNGYSYHRRKEVNDDHYLVGRTFLTDEP